MWLCINLTCIYMRKFQSVHPSHRRPRAKGVPILFSGFLAIQSKHLSRYTLFISGRSDFSASICMPFSLIWHNLLCHSSPVVSTTLTSFHFNHACITYSVLCFWARPTIRFHVDPSWLRNGCAKCCHDAACSKVKKNLEVVDQNSGGRGSKEKVTIQELS